MSNQVVDSYRFTTPCVDGTYENLPSETLIGRVINQAGNRLGMGFRPDSGHVMYEALIKSVKFKLDNDNRSPSNTIYSNVRASDGSLVGTIGTLDATTLTNTPVEYTFNTSEVQMSAGDFITIEYDYADDATQVRVYRTGSNNYITNASTLVSTSSLTSWATYYDGDYFWAWLESEYCA